jgi:hypothetical protein
LAATRDDARAVALANKIAIAAEEIGANAVSKGKVEVTRLSEISNAVSLMVNQGIAVDDHNGTVKIRMGTVADCLILQIIEGGGDSNLTLLHGNAGNDSDCMALQRITDTNEYPIPLTGKRVSY